MHDDQGGFFFFHSFDINNWAKLSIKLVKFKLRKPIFPKYSKNNCQVNGIIFPKKSLMKTLPKVD
jgi:hypothetical protein